MITQISCEGNVELSTQDKRQLLWWIQNLSLYNGKSLVTPPPQLIISSDASKHGWGASCQGKSTGRPLSLQQQKFHINVLKLMAAKLAIMTFITAGKDGISILFWMYSMATLLHLLKMGITKNAQLVTTGDPGSRLLQDIFQVQWT